LAGRPAALLTHAQAPETWERPAPAPVAAPGRLRRMARSSPTTLTAGMEVKHPFFGPGRVEAVLGPRTVDVFFPRHGRKTLHLDYAKLEVI
ncbi:MAG: ATP-dependent helicase, partial [Gaiellales bacterium]